MLLSGTVASQLIGILQFGLPDKRQQTTSLSIMYSLHIQWVPTILIRGN